MSVLGSELVSNGDFSTDTDWTFGGDWTRNNNRAEISGGAVSNLTQSISITEDVYYYITYNAAFAAHDLILDLGGTTDLNEAPIVGAQTATIKAGGDNTLIKFTNENGASGYIDNVSVKEISVATYIEAAVYDILRLNATVSDLISNRIYPLIVPQGISMPAVSYSQVSGNKRHTTADTDVMVESRWQFNCYDDDYGICRQLSDAVRDALDNFSDTAGSVIIQCAHMIGELDQVSEIEGADQLRRYAKILDFYIWYNE